MKKKMGWGKRTTMDGRRRKKMNYWL